MSEDEAFELISTIPATVGTGLGEKDACAMVERLSQAGCEVESHKELDTEEFRSKVQMHGKW